MSNWKGKQLIVLRFQFFFFFFVTDTYKNFSELIRVSDNTLVLYAENFDGVKTTKVTHASVHAVAYSVQLSHVHILNIFFIKNRGAYPAYIILSTLQQTRVQAGEFRLYVTWVRVAEMLSNRKLNKCIHRGFYKIFLIRYTYHWGTMKYSKMVHGILAKYHILALLSSDTKVNQGLNWSLTMHRFHPWLHSSTPHTLSFCHNHFKDAWHLNPMLW